jgi:hypothetical protein
LFSPQTAYLRDEPEKWSVRRKLLLKAPVPLPLETTSDVASCKKRSPPTYQ